MDRDNMEEQFPSKNEKQPLLSQKGQTEEDEENNIYSESVKSNPLFKNNNLEYGFPGHMSPLVKYCCCCFVKPYILNTNERYVMCELAQSNVLYDERRPSHERLFTQLWEQTFSVPLTEGLLSEKWKQIGFQGRNPRTDLRGGGILSLRCILYFAQHHTTHYNILKTQKYKSFPFAIAQINLAFFMLLFLYLVDEPTGREENRSNVFQYKHFARLNSFCDFAFEELVCYGMIYFMSLWEYTKEAEPYLTITASLQKAKEFLKAILSHKIDSILELKTRALSRLIQYIIQLNYLLHTTSLFLVKIPFENVTERNAYAYPGTISSCKLFCCCCLLNKSKLTPHQKKHYEELKLLHTQYDKDNLKHEAIIKEIWINSYGESDIPHELNSPLWKTLGFQVNINIYIYIYIGEQSPYRFQAAGYISLLSIRHFVNNYTHTFRQLVTKSFPYAIAHINICWFLLKYFYIDQSLDTEAIKRATIIEFKTFCELNMVCPYAFEELSIVGVLFLVKQWKEEYKQYRINNKYQDKSNAQSSE